MKLDAIVGPDLILRSWRPDEADIYLSARDGAIFEMTTEDPFLDESQCQVNIESAVADPQAAPFAICDRDDHPVGNLALSHQAGSVVVSYWLAPEARGRGMASAAIDLACHWAVDVWGARDFELEILEGNQASIRAAERAGFTRAGIRLASACGGPALVFKRAIDPRDGTDHRHEAGSD